MSTSFQEPNEMFTAEEMKSIPIFAGFTEREIDQLLNVAEIRTFLPKDIVLEEGKTSRTLWVLLEGQCEVVKHNGHGDVVLAMIGPQGNFGEMSFFHAAAHSASVRAVSNVRLLCLDRDHFDQLVASEPSVACKLSMNTVASLAERMRRMTDWVAELLDEKTPRPPISELSKLRDQLFNGWQL